jgi:hypothetical protein
LESNHRRNELNRYFIRLESNYVAFSRPVATSDGLHLVAYVGDANGDGVYSSANAMKTRRVLLQADTGFAAHPLVDPVIVADTDGAGFIPADAALQVNESGVGVATKNLPSPPLPAGVHFQAVAHAVTAASALSHGPRPLATPSSQNPGADQAAVASYFAQGGNDGDLGLTNDWSFSPTRRPRRAGLALYRNL